MDSCWRVVTKLELHILKLQNFNAMPETDNNELFYLSPPTALGVWLYCFTNGTPCFMRVHFLTPFGGPRFLVLVGGSPWKVRELGKIERRPPTRELITFLIAYRQLPTLKMKTSKISTLFSWNSKISPNWKLKKISNSLKFWTFLFRDWLNYSELFEEYEENHSFVKRDQQEPSTATLFLIKPIKLLVSKMTNPSRVQLAWKLS